MRQVNTDFFIIVGVHGCYWQVQPIFLKSPAASSGPATPSLHSFPIDCFQLDSFVFDVYFGNKSKVWLIDFAPAGPQSDTDPLLFKWSELGFEEERASHIAPSNGSVELPELMSGDAVTDDQTIHTVNETDNTKTGIRARLDEVTPLLADTLLFRVVHSLPLVIIYHLVHIPFFQSGSKWLESVHKSRCSSHSGETTIWRNWCQWCTRLLLLLLLCFCFCFCFCFVLFCFSLSLTWQWMLHL